MKSIETRKSYERPPFIDVCNFVEALGYDVFPIKEGKQYRLLIFKGEKLLKEGETLWDEWDQALTEGYKTLYDAITKS